MRIKLLSVCQFIRKVIKQIVLISRHVTFINSLQNTFKLFFLYNKTSYVDESIVKFSAWICAKRSTAESKFCIRQIVEKRA
jgi:hypothetical protein